MSKSPAQPPVNRERIRERLNRIHKSRRRGRLGVAEIVGLVMSGVLVLAVIVGYAYFLLPARSRVTSLMLERDRLQRQVRVSQDNFRQGEDAKAQVQKITESLANFESTRLVNRDGGRMLLYEELNQLIKINGLRNTSGPTYAGLEPLVIKGDKQVATSTSNSAAAKWQSLYPGIAVNVTVEGQYQNLRHFVQDVERSKGFIVINAVELERATESNTQPTAEAGGPKSSTGNALVSLRLDLATYFQRSGDSGPVTAER